MSPTPPRLSQPPLEPDAAREGTILTRFGTAVGAALVASALATGPAALRIASVDGPSGAWPALVASTLLPMLLAVVVLRRARVGLRSFAGSRALAIGVWLPSVFVVMVVLGSTLRATTHHHPLAGVTFSILSLIAAVGLAPFAARVAALLTQWHAGGRWVPLATTALLALFVAVFVAVRVARGLGGDGGDGAASASPPASDPGATVLVDLLAFGMAALLASRPELAARRVLAVFGPPVAAVVFVLGMTSLVRSAALARAVDDRAPAFSAAVHAVARR
jgi:hypothetical protein